MAITYIDSNTQDLAGGLSLTFTIPAAAQADDLLIAFVKQSENTTQREWDDDGGGGNGWTRLTYNRTTSGRDQETAIFWKIHDGSEPNPTFTWASGVTTEPMSGSLLVYRGTDAIDPISDFGFATSTNDANPPNPQVNVASTPTAIVVFHAATHDDISAVAPPTGYTLRTQVWSGTANDHRNHFTADLLGFTPVGSYTPPDWQHSVLNTTPEYHTYTLVLQEPVTIRIEDIDTDEVLSLSQTDVILTGFGFESSQGSGKLELWDDILGTTKVLQSIDSWSDTNIQFDSSASGIPQGTIYAVVTNNSGDVSAPFAITYGVPSYTKTIIDLSPDHFWKLDGLYTDTGITGPTRDMNSGIAGGGGTFVTPPISEDSTQCWNMNGITVRREITDSPNMNITNTLDERTVCGWIQLNGIQQSLGAIWKEGGGVQNLAMLVGLGNVLLVQQADTGTNTDTVQAISDFRLTPNRPYHVCLRYNYNGSPAEFNLYLDGELQLVTDGNPLTGAFNTHSGDVVWGDPDTNLETGGTDISYAGQSDCNIAAFATWSDNSANKGALDTITEIRDKLFRRGAVPNTIITSGTQADMQAQLDVIADTIIPDWPLGIRIEPPVGNGDIELVANNIVFDSRVTAQLEFRGDGTLTWVNDNGSNLVSNKLFNTGDGDVTIIESVPINVLVLDISTNAPVEGARVRLEAGTGGPLTPGTVIMEGLADVLGNVSTTLRYEANQPIIGKIRKGSSTIYYKPATLSGVVTDTGLNVTGFMVKDE